MGGRRCCCYQGRSYGAVYRGRCAFPRGYRFGRDTPPRSWPLCRKPWWRICWRPRSPSLEVCGQAACAQPSSGPPSPHPPHLSSQRSHMYDFLGAGRGSLVLPRLVASKQVECLSAGPAIHWSCISHHHRCRDTEDDQRTSYQVQPQ